MLIPSKILINRDKMYLFFSFSSWKKSSMFRDYSCSFTYSLPSEQSLSSPCHCIREPDEVLSFSHDVPESRRIPVGLTWEFVLLHHLYHKWNSRKQASQQDIFFDNLIHVCVPRITWTTFFLHLK